MYSIYYGTAVKKDIKALAKNVQDTVDEVFGLLTKDPQKGEMLRGEFLGYYSYHFRQQKTDYRIIYSIKNESLIVLVVLVGTRENIYKQLKRRV
jgi:mRNA interferase RelE/StbE